MTWNLSEVAALGILLVAGGTLLLLIPFAAHRTYLLYLARKPGPAFPGKWDAALPRVTVQLPVFNEPAVVERLIDAACALDYPRELLEVQLLDDSTDRTSELAASRVRSWRARGVSIRHIRRRHRVGFKAGALQEGLARATGEFVLILDADFVPPPDLVRALLPPFQNPEVGMVQARWDHLNEPESLLTRAQAYLLDGHFFFEHRGRFAAGRFFNFNGTGGMWRRSCLEAVGGWKADTLTEDLDLSYRAQMRGWKFAYLDQVGVPAELPSRVSSLEVQQRRWAQGGVQTARKVLPDLLRGPYPFPVKVEGLFHLCGHLAHPLTLVLGVLILPSALARQALGWERFLLLDLLVFGAATLPFLIFYGAAGRRRRRSWPSVLGTLPAVLAMGIGLTAAVSGAVLRGLGRWGERDPFLRTPKAGEHGRGGSVPLMGSGHGRRTVLKLALAGWMVFSFGVALGAGFYGSIPFIALFGSGWLALGFGALRESRSPPCSGVVRLPSPAGPGVGVDREAGEVA